MALTVVVLAAGQGKRMNSPRPKVMQPLGGRPVLAHVLDTARRLEPAVVRVVYGHGGEEVRAAFPDSEILWSLQSNQLGTGHALAQALPEIPDDHQVLVLYGDVPLISEDTLRTLVASAEGKGVAVLTAILEDPHGYGRVIRNERGELVRIVEENDASDEERRIREINTGLMALPAEALRHWLDKVDNANAQGEYYLTDVIGMAFEEGVNVKGVRATDFDEVRGINDKVQLAEAERVLRRRAATALMSAGATVADPARIDVRGQLKVGQDVFIDVGVVFEGDVELGDRVHIGPYSVIANARLGDDCLVHAHSVMDGVDAGPGCEIGPFARLRPGTRFEGRVKVGNFVEVKASDVSEGSKMNHLSYVGDTSVGRDVNVGAGTITCNYDGAAKHRTTIGDRVFVGSGVMLVAPVEVGDDATVGAGSTIAKDAPSGELTVARVRQTTVKGWKRPEKPTK